MGIRRTSPLLLTAALLLGCPPAPEPEPEPEPVLTETTLRATLVDRLTDVPLPDCEVGVDLASVVETDDDGLAELVVDAGAVVHARCDSGPVHSWRLPLLAELDWTLSIDTDEETDTDVWCSPAVHVDSSALGAGNGGSIELRILNDSQTAGFSTDFVPTLTLAGAFFVPEGDYKVFARAYDGTVGGFGRTELLTCAGDGSAPEVDLIVEQVDLRDLGGTWEPSSGMETELFAHRPLDDADFDWFSFKVAHRSSGNPVGWSLTLADGIGAGPLELEVCQSAAAATACLNLLDVDESGDLALGPLVDPVPADAQRDDATISIAVPLDLASGHMTVRLDDVTDPFDQVTLWRGWSPTAEIAVPREWLDGGASGDDVRARVFALDGANYDLGSAIEPTGFVSGWTSFSPPLTELAD